MHPLRGLTERTQITTLATGLGGYCTMVVHAAEVSTPLLHLRSPSPPLPPSPRDSMCAARCHCRQPAVSEPLMLTGALHRPPQLALRQDGAGRLEGAPLLEHREGVRACGRWTQTWNPWGHALLPRKPFVATAALCAIKEL
jgi:hypothetical protein